MNEISNILAERYADLAIIELVSNNKNPFSILIPKVEKIIHLMENRGWYSWSSEISKLLKSTSSNKDMVRQFADITKILSEFATTMRVLAGQGKFNEGFQEGQVGSSAMPHKMNPIKCERLCGFSVILYGFDNMLTRMDFFTKEIVEEIAIPSAIYAFDGALNTATTILTEMILHK